MKKLFPLIAIALLLAACAPKTHNVIKEELVLKSGDKDVYGVMYRPDWVEKAPLVIVSHGFGGSYMFGKGYADALAPLGYAVYCYDFCGGSNFSKSGGSTTEMSIFTEADDLKAVIDQLSVKEYIDPERIILIGESQGGMVSALVAAERKESIERLVLIYPALCIKDDWVTMYPKLDDMPEEVDFWGIKLSHTYLEGLYDLDVYATISQYEGPVKIFHGDNDQVVNVSYSERAVEAYKNAHLTVYPGEGHGFSPEIQARTIDAIKDLLDPELKNGDLIFVGLPMDYKAEEGSMDEAIASATGSPGELNLIHVAIAEVRADSVWVIDATIARGVDRHPLDTFLTDFTLRDGSLPEMIIKRVNGVDADAAVEKAKTFCGRGYDTFFLPDNEELYCSELVQNSYLDAAGGQVFPSQPMNFLASDGTMPPYWEWLFGLLGMDVPQGVLGTNPHDMSLSPLLEEVAVAFP